MDNKIIIFLSYKKEDERIAEKLRLCFLDIGGKNHTEVFTMARIKPGREWPLEIRKSLEKADSLVFLHTDPKKISDWCIYEAGYFDGIGELFRKPGEQEKRRPFCLHTTGIQIPAPLAQYQCVPAQEEDVKNLILDFFCTPPRNGVPPIRPEYREEPELLNQKAKNIVDLFKEASGLLEQKWYTHYFLLTVSGSKIKSMLEQGTIPNDSLVESDSKTMEIFGIEAESLTWGEIIGRLGEGEEQKPWALCISKVLQKAASRLKIDPSLPRFRVTDEDEGFGKLYQPVIHRIDRMSDKSLTVNVLLIEIPVEIDTKPMGDLGIMANLLSISRRFRWGILDKYTIELRTLRDHGASRERIRDCLQKLQVGVERIEMEAASRGFTLRSRVLEAFKTKDDRQAIGKIFNIWDELRVDLMKAIGSENLEEGLNVLSKLKKMNHEFMMSAVDRYKELLERSVEVESTARVRNNK